MSQSAGAAFINGEFFPVGEARVSVLDSGFWHGINVYDTLSAHQGFIFKLEAHMDRFFHSLHAVRIAIPYSREELGHLVIETVRRSGLQDAYIQCIATRGPAASGPIDQWPPTTIIYAIPYFAIAGEEAIQRGLRIRISSTRNIPPQCLDPKIKSFNRLHSYLARLEALDCGADDVVMLDVEGYVTEGRAANVFVVEGGRLRTPGGDMLRGVTRETVLEIAAREGIPADECQLTPYNLYEADEVFYSTTAGGIVPIVEVDRRRVADGKAGPVTRRIEEIYWQMHLDPHYSTPVYTATFQQP